MLRMMNMFTVSLVVMVLECVNMSKLLKLYILNTYRLLYANCTSVKQLLNAIPKWNKLELDLCIITKVMIESNIIIYWVITTSKEF